MKQKQTSFRLIVSMLVFMALLAACKTPTPIGPRPAGTQTVAPPTTLPAPGSTQAAPAATVASAAQPTAAVATATQPPADTAVANPTATPVAGQPNHLVIPKLGLDTAIVDVGWEVVERDGQRVTEWQTADNAAGRHLNSARPGEKGNVVLSGHHNTKGEVFRSISEGGLAVGDMLYLFDATGRRYSYQVSEVTEPLLEVGATEAQRLANASYIQPTQDARVTLVTCWPYISNTHRVIVVAKLVQ